MKKVLFILFAAFMSLQMSYADDIVTKDLSKLPLQARNFLSTHFKDLKLQTVKIDKDDKTQLPEYTVDYTNGVEVEFDDQGNWKEIDMKRKAVPTDIVPQFILNYMKTNNLADKVLYKLKRCKEGYEADINNGKTLYFFNDGKFDKAVKTD